MDPQYADAFERLDERMEARHQHAMLATAGGLTTTWALVITVGATLAEDPSWVVWALALILLVAGVPVMAYGMFAPVPASKPKAPESKPQTREEPLLSFGRMEHPGRPTGPAQPVWGPPPPPPLPRRKPGPPPGAMQIDPRGSQRFRPLTPIENAPEDKEKE